MFYFYESVETQDYKAKKLPLSSKAAAQFARVSEKHNILLTVFVSNMAILFNVVWPQVSVLGSFTNYVDTANGVVLGLISTLFDTSQLSQVN